LEPSELFKSLGFVYLGAGLPTWRFWGWSRVPRIDHFWSVAAVTILAHMARLAAAEAGPFGHQLHTFRFGEGAQSPPSQIFSHISGIMGRFFRDESCNAPMGGVRPDVGDGVDY